MRPVTKYAIRRTGSLFALVAGIVVPVRPAASQAPGTLALKRDVLADGVYLFRAPRALDMWTSTNVVVIINDQDVTVFDSNTRPLTAQMVIAEIRKLTNKPVRTLINSHWHMDHWGGNQAYASAFPGIQILATTQTREFMKRITPRFFETAILTGLQPERAALDTAIRTGKEADGSPLTAEDRRVEEQGIARMVQFAKEISGVPRVLPNLVYVDTLVFWKGGREFRLFSETGDATASTVLYLPKERILVTGDVLVSPEDGKGPPPWTTNSYKITPWLAALRSFSTLDVDVIVPGQGPAMHDKTYLTRTIHLFASIIDQVHAALERGLVTQTEVLAAVNGDSIAVQYAPGTPLPSDFPLWMKFFTNKVYQESRDGGEGP